MGTTLENTWIPPRETGVDLVGSWMGVKSVQKDVLKILTALVYRGYRGKGRSAETCPQVKILLDSHSNLTSDDLLWYIQGMKEDELGILRSIKIKNDSMVIPRVLSAQIQGAINNLR